LVAAGTAIALEAQPYEIRYRLLTRSRYITRTLVVECRGVDWSRRLRLDRSATGSWQAQSSTSGAQPGEPPASGALDLGPDVLDVDVESSPLFNTTPVLRHDLFPDGGTADFTMAWISMPALTVHSSRQRYTGLRDRDGLRMIRFATLDAEPFTADVAFDSDGLVVDYPQIAERVAG
jgi:hypothetical protein